MPPMSFRIRPPSGRSPSILATVHLAPFLDINEAKKRGCIPAHALAAALGYGGLPLMQSWPEGFLAFVSAQSDVEAYHTSDGYYLAPESFRLLLEAPVLLTGWTNMDRHEAPKGWGIDHGDIGLVFTPHGVIAYDYNQLDSPPPRSGNKWDLRRAYYQFFLEKTKRVTRVMESKDRVLTLQMEEWRERISAGGNVAVVVNVPPYQPPSTSRWNHPWIVQVGGGVVVLLVGLVIGFFIRL